MFLTDLKKRESSQFNCIFFEVVHFLVFHVCFCSFLYLFFLFCFFPHFQNNFWISTLFLPHCLKDVFWLNLFFLAIFLIFVLYLKQFFFQTLYNSIWIIIYCIKMLKLFFILQYFNKLFCSFRKTFVGSLFWCFSQILIAVASILN